MGSVFLSERAAIQLIKRFAVDDVACTYIIYLCAKAALQQVCNTHALLISSST